MAIQEARIFRIDVGRAKDAAGVLVKFLTDHKTGSDRIIAIEALGEIGPKAKDALPQLRNVAEAADKKEADAARQAIKKIEMK